MTCTLKECGEPSTLHLCEEHRLELTELIKGVDFLIVNLDPNIQAGKVTKKAGGQEGGNGTSAGGSRPPTTDTGLIRYWLWELPRNAYTEARDNEHAGRTLHMARIWVGKAEEAVYGPADDKPSKYDTLKAAADIREHVPEELPVPALIEWLKNVHQMDIKPSRIWQWAKRGHLTRTNEHGRAKYSPAAVLIHARHDQLERLDKVRKTV